MVQHTTDSPRKDGDSGVTVKHQSIGVFVFARLAERLLKCNVCSQQAEAISQELYPVGRSVRKIKSYRVVILRPDHWCGINIAMKLI
jgi:hypothetical protein